MKARSPHRKSNAYRAESQTKPPRVNWDKVNVELYRQHLNSSLSNYSLEKIPATHGVEILESAMAEAALQAMSPPPRSKKARRKKQRRKPWPPDVAQAVLKSRHIHYMWKEAGSPSCKDHPLSVQQRKASRAVRTAQRVLAGQARSRKYKEISKASADDTKLFHSLIRQHRGGSANTRVTIVVDGQPLSDPQEAADSWGDYYGVLSTPSSNPSFDDSYLSGILQENKTIDNILSSCSSAPPLEISTKSTETIVGKLNSGKAPDFKGITSEHITKAKEITVKPITEILNSIHNQLDIPPHLKEGIKTPIPKKGKDPTIQSNARGITVTPVIGKVLEHSILAHQPIPAAQNQLQYGFTAGVSPVMASLCFTEILAEARNTKQLVFMASLDAQKAFDVVSHQILIYKLMTDGAHRSLVKLIKDLYDGATERISWQGHFSQPYTVDQGVRQGAILSTSLYKLYINNLLEKLQDKNLGFRIGHIYLGVVACADDVILLAASEHELQLMLDIALRYSAQHRYILHPEKSIQSSNSVKYPPSCLLGSTPLTQCEKVEHLGISRNVTLPNYPHEVITDRISLGRRTAYAMMSVRLHGEGGLNPTASTKIIETYITPRMLYGLESLMVKSSSLKDLDRAHRQLLRDTQSLPPNTASEALYLLSGTLPLSVELLTRKLTLFSTICNLSHANPLREIADRQLAVRSSKSHSWFADLQSLVSPYDLSLPDLMDMHWPKRVWKNCVVRRIKSSSFMNLMLSARTKSSLKYLDLSAIKEGHPHPVWAYTGHSPAELSRVAIRVKLLTGTYILQANRAKFNQYDPDPTCKLCGTAVEDRPHFLLHCPSLESSRKRHLTKLIAVMNYNNLPVPQSDDQWCLVILNGNPGCLEDEQRTLVKCTHNLMPSGSYRPSSTLLVSIASLVNNLCFDLHKLRMSLLMTKLTC